MKLLKVINQFYYDMALSELRMMNENLYQHISYTSMRYLDLIAYTENCTASYLAKALHVSRPAVTSKINELVRLGLVEKIQSHEDRRVFYLSVSQEIAEENKRFDRAVQYAVEQVQKQYSDTDVDHFCEILQTVCKCYKEGVSYE